MRDLTCCLTMGTVTTTWILRENGTLKISGLDDEIHFKSVNEGVHLFFTFSPHP